MISLLPDIRDKVVLEVGIGIGDFHIELVKRARNAYKEYIGLDISFLNLVKAKELDSNMSLAREDPSFVQANIFSLPFKNGSADILICAEVLEHLDDLKAMEEMGRVLKNGGHLLLTVPYLGEPVEGWGHLRHYDLNMIGALAAKTGFIIKKTNIFGRFHEVTWVRLKRVCYKIWELYHGSKRDYYESGFHRYLIMPLGDMMLRIDDLFASPRCILGDKGYLVAVLEKEKYAK